MCLCSRLRREVTKYWFIFDEVRQSNLRPASSASLCLTQSSLFVQTGRRRALVRELKNVRVPCKERSVWVEESVTLAKKKKNLKNIQMPGDQKCLETSQPSQKSLPSCKCLHSRSLLVCLQFKPVSRRPERKRVTNTLLLFDQTFDCLCACWFGYLYPRSIACLPAVGQESQELVKQRGGASGSRGKGLTVFPMNYLNYHRAMV